MRKRLHFKAVLLPLAVLAAFGTASLRGQSPAFEETFESSSTTASQWTNSYVTGTKDWTLGTGSSGGSITSAYEGSQNLVFTSSSGGPHVTRAVSPAIDLSGLVTPDAKLSFWYAQETWSSDQNYLNVYARSSSTASWTLVFSDSTEKASWTQAEVRLPDSVVSSTTEIALEGIDNWGRAPVVDLLTIDNLAPTSAQGLACGGSTAPSVIFSEEFDDNSAGWTGDINSSTGSWEIPDGSTSFGTGADNPHSGSNYMNYEASSTSPNSGSIVSPAINLGAGADDAELSFWMHAYGASMGTLEVGVGTSASGPFTTELTWTGEIQSSGSDAWVNAGVDLSAYLGQTIYIQLTQHDTLNNLGSGFDGDMSIDLFEVSTCVGCATPGNNSSSNVAATSADLDWTENGSATSWEISYDTTAGFTAGNGTQTVVNSKPFTVTGLSPNNTTYDWYVRSICSAGDTSAWSASSGSFTTLCNVFTAPYSEDFETGSGTTPPNCWTNESEGGGQWEFDDETSRQPETSDGDHTLGPNGGGIMAWIDDSDDEDSTNMLSPMIDISGLSTPRLVFYMWSETEGSNPTQQFPLHIDVYNGTNWVYDVKVFDIENNSWEQQTVDLSSFSDTIQIRFSGEDLDGSFYKDIAIDDVSVEETPSCISPSSLSVSNLQATSADLAWTDNNSPAATSWEISYDTSGFTAGAGTQQVVSTNPVNVTGLNSNTSYDWYVRSICGASDTSSWSSAGTFVTPCAAFSAPYSQNFDGTADPNIDNCWSTINTTSSSSARVNTENSSFDPQRSAPNSIEFYNSSGSGGELLLISPEFSDLDSTKQVVFYAQDEGSSFYTSGLVIGTMSDPTDANTFHPYDSIPNSMLDGSWKRFTITFDTLTRSDKYIAIGHDQDDSFDYIFLDDFSYENIPTCPQPVSLRDSNVTSTTANLLWDGNGSDYQYGVVPQGAGTPSSPNLTSSGSPVTATGLTSGVAYDFYVREICAAGDTSKWSGPASFVTPPATASGPACSGLDAPNVVFSEDFDNNNAGWTGDINSSNGSWEIPDGAFSSGTGADNAYSGSNYMNYEASNTSANSGSIVTPAIDLSNANQAAELSFWMHAYGASMGTLDIGVGTSASGPFTSEFTWTGPLQTSGSDPWVNVGVDLSAYVGQTIYIQLTQHDTLNNLGSGFDGDMSIDLFEVRACEASTPRTITCNTGVNVPVVSESFEAGLGGWTGDFGTSNGDFQLNSGGTGSSSTGPSSAHDGSQYIYYEASSSSNYNTLTTIQSPPIDLSQSSDFAELSFWVHAYGSNMGQLYIKADTTATGSFSDTLLTIDGELQTSGSDPWLNAGINLDAYVGKTVYLELDYQSGSSFRSDIALDLFEVNTCLTCPAPSNLSASNVTSTSVDIAWDSAVSTPANGYNYEVVPQGNLPGNATVTSGNLPGTSVTASGLSGNTIYDLYVQADCSGSDQSPWVGPVSITTLCTSFGTPYVESFDTNAVPSCWTRYEASGSGWEFGQQGSAAYAASNAAEQTGNGGYYAWIDHSGGDDSATLEAPVVDVSALTTPALIFDFYSNNTDNSTTNILYVEAWDGSNWAQVDSIKENNSDWVTKIIDLTGFSYGSNLMKLRFRTEEGGGSSDFYNDLLIDDVTIDELPTCFPPTNLSVTSTTDSSISFSWTTGGAGNWQVEYDTAGFSPGNGTIVSSSADSITITGLNPTTDYHFFVRDSCGPNDVSPWAGPITGRTDYCSAAISCSYTLDMFDSWGDGWNGNEVEIYQNGNFTGTFGQNFTNGDSLTGQLVDFCPNQTVDLILNEGSFSGEISFYILAPNGDTAAFHPESSGLNTGDTLGSFTTAPLANAGTDDSLTVCETSSSVDLTAGIGTYDFGGTWNDLDQSGALTDSIFDVSSAAVGQYDFSYTVMSSNGCGMDTAMVSVSVEASADAGADSTIDACTDDPTLQLSSFVTGNSGGVWSDLDNSGAFDTATSVLTPASSLAGNTYRFAYVDQGTACPSDSAIFAVSFEAPANAGSMATDTLCDTITMTDLSGYLSTAADTGGSWIDVNGTGALSGSILDPSGLAFDSTYQFQYVVTADCGDDTATVSVYIEECVSGVSEYLSRRVTLFPNPAKNVVNVETSGTFTNLKVEVLSANGQSVMTKLIETSADKRLDVSRLPKGVYTVQIHADQGMAIKRFVKN